MSDGTVEQRRCNLMPTFRQSNSRLNPNSSLTHAGFELYVASPPYEHLRPLTGPVMLPQPRGSVLVVNVVQPDRVEVAAMTEVVREARQRGCAAALRLPEHTEGDCRHLLLDSHPIGFRAVLLENEPIRQALWRHLARPHDMAGDWVDWMGLHGEISGRTAKLLVQIVRSAPTHRSIGEACEMARISSRTLRHRCKLERLPNPERWFDAARLIDAQIRLQFDPELSVGAVAAELGYADDMSFSNRVSRVFGVTAATARGLLGLEWRFHWWKKLVTERRMAMHGAPADGADAGSR